MIFGVWKRPHSTDPWPQIQPKSDSENKYAAPFWELIRAYPVRILDNTSTGWLRMSSIERIFLKLPAPKRIASDKCHHCIKCGLLMPYPHDQNQHQIKTSVWCVCVCVALVIPHVNRMRHITLSSAASLPYFFTLSHNRHFFRGGGGSIERKMFWFSLQLLPQIVLMLKRIQRDSHIYEKLFI
jgi:hypothetical protein